MFDTLMPALRQLLEARIENARHTLRMTIGIALLLLAIVGYFAAGACFSTINSVSELTRNARSTKRQQLSAS